ncbi:hypothetical protein M3J09_004922 [Ascochyta lentis]
MMAATARATAPLSMRTPHVELGSVAKMTRIPLLDLPGEIRNRIYKFAVEKQPIFLSHITSKPLEELSKDRSEHCQQFFGLTQVCRQIRSEYLPLYRSRTKVTCRALPHNVYDYIDTFLKRSGVKDEDVVGDLIIDFKAGRLQSINIKPLLQLSKKAKHFSVRIKDNLQFCGNNEPKWNLEELVDQILFVKNKPAFSNWLETAVFALELTSDDEYLFIGDIAFFINGTQWEPWMKYWGTWYWGWGPENEEWPNFNKWTLTSGFFPHCQGPYFSSYITFQKRD